MAITPLRKITLCGIKYQEAEVLVGLQSLGCVHLLSLRDEQESDEWVPPSISVEGHKALEYLKSCSTRQKQVRDPDGFLFAATVSETLQIRSRMVDLKDERDQLLETIDLMRPWGEFQRPKQDEIGAVQFWFYLVPHLQEQQLPDDVNWHIAKRDHRYAYVVVLSENRPKGMPVKPVPLDERPLSELTKLFEAIELELDDLRWKRIGLTRWIYLLSQTLHSADDAAARDRARRQTLPDQDLLVIQGWSPVNQLAKLQAFAAQHSLALTVESPTETDSPPTLLENPELLAGGEGAVTFYMVPGYRTWDPSITVFFSFALFFAMIFSDAGYGVVLGIILLFLWGQLSQTPESVRIRNLILALVLATIGYGIIAGSYFGLEPPTDSPLAQVRLLNITDQARMMQLAIGIGGVHIILANLVAAWGKRWSLSMLGPIGWAVLIVGGLTFGLFEETHPLSWIVVATGVTMIFLFSSPRPWLTSNLSDHLMRLLEGFQGLTGISKAFGDILSYLRLFALGLASAQLATTFNELAGQIFAETRGIGIVLGGMVLLIGHGLNFALAIMSGVVHGLRLNCIEFFNWCLPEEGYLFQAFRKKADW